MASEINDDLNISTIEISDELGINLTSDNTRIKHDGEGELIITSTSSSDNAVSICLPDGGMDVTVLKTIGFTSYDDSLQSIKLEAYDGGIGITALNTINLTSTNGEIQLISKDDTLISSEKSIIIESSLTEDNAINIVAPYGGLNTYAQNIFTSSGSSPFFPLNTGCTDLSDKLKNLLIQTQTQTQTSGTTNLLESNTLAEPFGYYSQYSDNLMTIITNRTNPEINSTFPGLSLISVDSKLLIESIKSDSGISGNINTNLEIFSNGDIMIDSNGSNGMSGILIGTNNSIPITIGTTGTLTNIQGNFTVGGNVVIDGDLQVNGSGGSGIQNVYVTNFPGTQSISGSVLIQGNDGTTNRLILTDNTGIVQTAITNSPSVSVSNFPVTQPVSGSVSVSNFPTTQEVSGSVSVSNFPTTQEVSGSVNSTITNTSIAVTGDFYPTTQPVSGSVSVSNFPTTQAVSGSVNSTITNTSIAVTGDFYPTTQPVSGSVSVSNFPTTQAVSGSVNSTITNTSIAVTGDFYPTTQPVSGSVSVSNFPTTQNVNTISNFATETGGNLASIKTNTDKIHNDLTHTDAIQVEVKNNSIDTHCYVSSNGTTWNYLSSDANGQLNVHSKIQDGVGTDITSTTIGAKQALDVNLAGGSISVSSVNIKDTNGNNIEVVGSTVPQLKVSIYDGSQNMLGIPTKPLNSNIYADNTAITSTLNGLKQSLDVNVSNFPTTQAVSGSVNSTITNTSIAVTGDFYPTTQPVSGSVSVSNFPTTQPVSGSVSVSNFPTTQAVSGSVNSTITNTSIAVTGDFYPTTQPVSGSVSVSNLPTTQAVSGSVSVSNLPTTQAVSGSVSVSNFPTTQAVSGTVSATISTASSIKIADTTNTAAVLPVVPNTGITNLSTSNGLVTCSSLFGYCDGDGTTTPLTTIKNGARTQLETRDNDANTNLSAINTKAVQQYNTTNDGSVIGLNMYQIRPKVKFYNMAAISKSAFNNRMLGSDGNTKTYYENSFGIANTKIWYAKSQIVGRTINYEYVDNTGAIGNYSVILPINTWTIMNKAGNVAGTFLINKWDTTTSPTDTSGLIHISYDSESETTALFGGNFVHTFNAIFTVPTGYVAWVTNINFDSNIASTLDYLSLLKWSATGVRSVVFQWSSLNRFTQNHYNGYGGCGGVFTAGETIGWATLNNASYKQIYATVMCMPV